MVQAPMLIHDTNPKSNIYNRMTGAGTISSTATTLFNCFANR
ncbi:hypothetical protein ACE1AT_17165 [Pelatocladus sp. BLCC-F211]